MRFEVIALCAMLTIVACPISAEPLTLEGALSIARTRAPAIRVARAAAEQRVALAQADTLLLPDNPEIEIGGRRRGDGSFGDEYELSVMQPLSGLVTHSRRSALARAAVEGVAHDAEAAEIRHLMYVAAVFLRTADAERRVAIAKDIAVDAGRLEDALRVRFEAGDVARVELNLARAEALRANARVSAAVAALLEERAELRTSLGLAEDASFELRDDTEWWPPMGVERKAWVAAAPAVRALDREIDAARAEASLASALFATEWTLGISTGREEGDRVFEAGLGVSLPVFDRRQAARAAATARLRRTESEREMAVSSLEQEIEAAASSFWILWESLNTVDRELIPLLEENVALATESWEAGRSGLVDLLLVRRELHDALLERTDQFRTTRESEVRLRFLAGDLP